MDEAPWPGFPSSLYEQPGLVPSHRLAVPGRPRPAPRRVAQDVLFHATPRLACSQHSSKPFWPPEGTGAVSALATQVFTPRMRPLHLGSISAQGGQAGGDSLSVLRARPWAPEQKRDEPLSAAQVSGPPLGASGSTPPPQPRLPAGRGEGWRPETQLASAIELALVGLPLGLPGCGWCVNNHMWVMS